MNNKSDKSMKEREDEALNRDPLSGEVGAHPVGTGLGAAAGGAALGAAAGAVGGPIGAAIGAAVGGVAGGLAGKSIAENIDPTVEAEYWQENYKDRDYTNDAHDFDAYEPAYRYGWESRIEHDGREFEDVESELASTWNKRRGQSQLDWDSARPATKEAWERVNTPRK